jgi:hypothetical protein
VTDLLEKIRQTDAADREKSTELYREILLRADAPKSGDEKLLRQAMTALSKTPADLERDFAIIRQADALEKQSRDAEDPQLERAVAAAGDAWNAYVDETKRIIAERDQEEYRLGSVFRDKQRKQTQGRDACHKLETLKVRHPDLFGGQPAAGDTAGSESVQLIGEPKGDQDILPSPDAPAKKVKVDDDNIPLDGRDVMVQGDEGGDQFRHLPYAELRNAFDADRRKILKSMEGAVRRGEKLDAAEQDRLDKLRERYGQPAVAEPAEAVAEI